MAKDIGVGVDDLKRFRREIRGADKAIDKELQADFKDVAEDVAREASFLVTRKSGKAAAAYRGTANGSKALVRNRVFYSRFIEFDFHPGGGSTVVPGQAPIGRAVERQENAIVDSVGDAIEAAAQKLGWH